MKKPTSFWLTIAAIVACIGCCSIPLYALFVGSVGLAVLLNETTAAILKCALPLAVLGIGYWVYQKRQARKRCCSSPQAECNSQKCACLPEDSH